MNVTFCPMRADSGVPPSKERMQARGLVASEVHFFLMASVPESAAAHKEESVTRETSVRKRVRCRPSDHLCGFGPYIQARLGKSIVARISSRQLFPDTKTSLSDFPGRSLAQDSRIASEPNQGVFPGESTGISTARMRLEETTPAQTTPGSR